MVENLGPLGSDNSSRVFLMVPKRAVGAVGFRLITIGSVSFTAVTRVQIPSGTPNRINELWFSHPLQIHVSRHIVLVG